MARGTPQLTLRLDHERRAGLEALARQRGKTRVEVLREALDRLIAAEKQAA